MPYFIPPFNYEYIRARGKGHQWRVGDRNDNVVCDFATEKEAKEYCRKANADEIRPNWSF